MCVRRNVTETTQRIPQITLDDDPALADGEAVVLTPQRGNVFLQEGKCFEGILNRKKSETRNKKRKSQEYKNKETLVCSASAPRTWYTPCETTKLTMAKSLCSPPAHGSIVMKNGTPLSISM